MSSPTQAVAPVAAAVDVPELVFASGLPGFPGERRFALVRWGAFEGPYSLMVDLDNPDVRFLVMPPYVFFPDYVVDLEDSIAAKVHLERAEDCLLLVIVTLGSTPEEATANLLGPVVINLKTREGMQAVLAESGHSTRVPLRAAA
ncbi:MAG: Flagellar assembly factor FliW [Frankiales bacterium]|nr:Flagellar assembly factor FliW [Frankiales bacterium]